MKKTIVIMCKSVKHYPNYCIAGIDTTTGEWIRPISNNDNLEGAVLVKDATYANGTEVEVFDVVEIEMIKACPTKAQKENYLYNDKVKWKKVGERSLEDVIKFRGFDKPNFIFSNIKKSIDNSKLNGTSLLLVQVQNPTVNVKQFPEKKKPSFNFMYSGNNYNYIQIGDIEMYRKYVTYDEGMYRLGNIAIAVFSLTGQYKDGQYYKMLAQLF